MDTVTIALAIAIVAGVAAILYGLFLVQWVLRQPRGESRMIDIAQAIQEGAEAYMRRQYTLVAIVAVVITLLLGLLINWSTAIGFVVGATASAAAGFIGMSVAVRSNVRTAEAAKSGLAPSTLR